MARDRAACVVRQAAVLRHGVGLGSRRARWGAGHAGRSGGRRRTLGAGRAGAGHAEGAQARGAGGAGGSGTWGQRGERGKGAQARQAPGLGAGRSGWLRAVHSVHSACFQPGLTRYCS